MRRQLARSRILALLVASFWVSSSGIAQTDSTVGVAVGALIPRLGGRVVQDQGDRMIVERDGEFYVRKDENLLLRRPGVTEETETFAEGITRSTVTREDGSQIVTVRDSGGFVLKRTRFLADGTETVLIDETREIYEHRTTIDYDQTLPPLRHSLPNERYIVDYSRASGENVRQTLLAPPPSSRSSRHSHYAKCVRTTVSASSCRESTWTRFSSPADLPQYNPPRPAPWT